MIELALLKKFVITDHVPPVVYENLPVIIYKKSLVLGRDWKIDFNIKDLVGFQYFSLDVKEEDLIRGEALDVVLPVKDLKAA